MWKIKRIWQYQRLWDYCSLIFGGIVFPVFCTLFYKCHITALLFGRAGASSKRSMLYCGSFTPRSFLHCRSIAELGPIRLVVAERTLRHPSHANRHRPSPLTLDVTTGQLGRSPPIFPLGRVVCFARPRYAVPHRKRRQIGGSGNGRNNGQYITRGKCRR